MSDLDRYETTNRDIAVLYELALSTGRTLDLKGNCRQFIKRLMGRKNIGFCSVWVRNNQLDDHGDDSGATIIEAYPEHFSLTGHINNVQQYFSALEKTLFVEIGPGNPVYYNLTADSGLSGGLYLLYALGRIGLVQFYFSRAEAAFSTQELHQLGGVMEKFTISLQGCLAFRRLQTEVAQREKKEQELRVSEEKHRHLFETMVQGVIYQDVEGRIISANPAAEKIVGLALGEMLGRSVLDPALKTIREDGSPLPVTAHPVQVALTTGKAMGPETLGILQPSSGKLIWLLITAIPLFKPGAAEPFQLYTTITDITEKRRIEQEYQVLFREMLNGFALHEIILDDRGVPVDYRFLAVNPAFERITGLSAAEVVGKTIFEVLPTTENEWVIIYGRVALTGEPIYIENYSSALDKYFEVTAFSPAPGQFATIFADITERHHQHEALQEARLQLESRVEERTAALRASNTALQNEVAERKRAEAALAEEKEFLQVTLHSIGDGVVITDTAEKITSINQEAENITGWSGAEVVGGPLDRMVKLFADESQSVLFDRPLKLILEEQTRGSPEHKFLQTRDSHVKIAYCNAAPIRDKADKLIGYVIVLKDITDIKKMEANLALAQKLESIGQLAAGIAHEINTPMQYISDNAHFLKEAFSYLVGACNQFTPTPGKTGGTSGPAEAGKPEDTVSPVDLEFFLQETPEAIAQTLEGIGQVGRIVAAMKNFSHSSLSGKKPADLNSAIMNTLTVSRNEWKYVADLSTELDPQLPLVECDIGSINQVVLNMIINAAHALKDATGTGLIEKGLIKVSTEAGPGTVLIKIADNGTGIDPLFIDKIFDPFFTTKEVGQGTGQGLMIAHDIVANKHGGSIDVRSEPGKGAEFTITLPLGYTLEPAEQ